MRGSARERPYCWLFRCLDSFFFHVGGGVEEIGKDEEVAYSGTFPRKKSARCAGKLRERSLSGALRFDCSADKTKP